MAETRPPPASKRPPTPGWVKVFGALAAVVVVLVVVALLLGGHGPSRHGAARDAAASAFAPLR